MIRARLDGVIGRRDLLRSLGAGAALAALAPLTGCGGRAARTGSTAAGGRDPLRAALRAAVLQLGTRLDQPTAYLLERRRVRALVDVAQADVADEQVTVVVLAGTDGGRRVERCFDDVTPARIAAVAAELVTAARGPARASIEVPAATDRRPRLDLDPAELTPRGWLDRVRSIAARGARHATSRIVYRASYLTCEDDRVWVIGAGGDRAQRLVRTRMGTTFVAWHGSEPMAGEAEVAGAHGPTPDLLEDGAIAEAAAAALALFTPTAPPTGERPVLLDPRVVAAVLDRGLATLLAGGGPAPAAALTVIDDPTRPGYGTYAYDDDGAPAAATRLIEGGAVVGRLGTGNARRSGRLWRLTRAPSNLVVTPGETAAAALEAGVDDGVVIAGVRGVDLDDTGAIVVRAARARELIDGRRTGRAWDDVELRADVRALCAAITGVSAEHAAVAITGDGPPRSVVAPWLLTRATVGSARSVR